MDETIMAFVFVALISDPKSFTVFQFIINYFNIIFYFINNNNNNDLNLFRDYFHNK